MSEPVEYMVKDPQGNVYGPATIGMLRQWVREGRIISTMQIAPQGTSEWREVGQHPEMADLFPAAGPVPGAGAVGVPGGAGGAAPARETYGTSSLPYSQPQTNGLAVASLICSLIWFCGVGAILGIIFGFIARSQIRANPQTQTGDGLALAGIIIGFITLGGGCLLMTAWFLMAAAMSTAPHMR